MLFVLLSVLLSTTYGVINIDDDDDHGDFISQHGNISHGSILRGLCGHRPSQSLRDNTRTKMRIAKCEKITGFHVFSKVKQNGLGDQSELVYGRCSGPTALELVK